MIDNRGAFSNSMKYGLKLWSTNTDWLDIITGLFKKGVFDYIELYVVPGSMDQCLDHWKKYKVPFLLHAPHSYSGLNLSLRESESINRLLVSEVESFRFVLNPKKIIFHPGIQGSIDETIRQILLLRVDFPEVFKIALIENKPKMGLKGETCIGSSPSEIAKIIRDTGIGFCLDIGHAIYYASWAGLKYENVISDFLTFKPTVFHLSDGHVNSKTDLHLNFGKGNFLLAEITKNIPPNAYLTIETDKDIEGNLKDFEQDVTTIKLCRYGKNTFSN